MDTLSPWTTTIRRGSLSLRNSLDTGRSSLSFDDWISELLEASELVATVISALRESDCSSEDHQTLITQLSSLEEVLRSCRSLTLENLPSELVSELQQAVIFCQTRINSWLEDIERRQPSGSEASESNGAVTKTKIHWDTCNKDDLEDFGADLTMDGIYIQGLMLQADITDLDFERGKDLEKSYPDEKRPAGRASDQTLLQYRPLDKVKLEFRLLILLPPKSSWDEPVGCKIEHAYLDDPPQYYALSYHRGDPLVTTPLRVNGQDVRVTTNLDAALRELRTRGINTIWVDALCINHKDPVEKGLQVMHMGLIYSKAVEVLAWIGQETEGSVIAMNRLAGFKIPVSEAMDSRHTRDLFGRPYWKRAWIIQEISKARKVQVLCGRDMVSWDQFNASSNRLGPLIPREVRSLQRFRFAETSNKESTLRFTLLKAMLETRSSISSDARDKIYALLGLTTDGAELVPSPNYTRPAQSIYYETLRAIISRTPQFAYITEEEDNIASSGQEPDWTNFDIGVAYWIVLFLEGQPLPPHSFPSSVQWKRWPTSPLSASYTPVLSKFGLNVSGRILDSINSIASSFPGPAENRPLNLRARNFGPRPMYRDFSSGQSPVLPKYPREAALILRDIWQAVTAKNTSDSKDIFQNGQVSYPGFVCDPMIENFDELRVAYALTTLFQASKELSNLPTDERDWYKQCSNKRSDFRVWLQENRDLFYYGQTLEKWAELYSETETYKKGYRKKGGFGKRLRARGMEPCWRDISQFLDEVDNAAKDAMRLAISEKSILSLVPSQTRIGDVVCLLRACTCPIILRPKGEAYVFVGLADHYPYCYDEHRENLLKGQDNDWKIIHVI